MPKYIATQLHKALEIDPSDPILNRMSIRPHYVIDQRLVEMFGRADVKACLKALMEVEMAHLPFPEIVIEVDARGARRFALIREQEGGFAVDLATLGNKGEQTALTITTAPARVYWRDQDLRVEGYASKVDGLMAGFAVAMGLLILVTRGIDKEVIDPSALNRKREQRAQGNDSDPIPIPRHTVLHIGTVYDKNDKPVKGLSRHVVIHLRAGHARNQAYGEGYSLRKMIFIPPCLVNYKPGDDLSKVALPKRIVTK